MMRNILILLSLLFSVGASTAWAADPLVGPGKVGEKDAKGHVKGVDAGAGPHRHFNQQFERRVDTPEEAAEKEKKEKEEKAKKEEREQQQAESKSR
jgi:Mg-chelatase subunit ChlI